MSASPPITRERQKRGDRSEGANVLIEVLLNCSVTPHLRDMSKKAGRADTTNFPKVNSLGRIVTAQAAAMGASNDFCIWLCLGADRNWSYDMNEGRLTPFAGTKADCRQRPTKRPLAPTADNST
jgi:hypothetical protein